MTLKELPEKIQSELWLIQQVSIPGIKFGVDYANDWNELGELERSIPTPYRERFRNAIKASLGVRGYHQGRWRLQIEDVADALTNCVVNSN